MLLALSYFVFTNFSLNLSTKEISSGDWWRCRRSPTPFNFCSLSVDIFARRISSSACRINIPQGDFCYVSRYVSELFFKFFFYLWFPDRLIKIGFVTCFPLRSQLHPVWLLGQDPHLSLTQDFLPWESVFVYYYRRLWLLRSISNGRMMSFIGCLESCMKWFSSTGVFRNSPAKSLLSSWFKYPPV